jgi:hypothetical protein
MRGVDRRVVASSPSMMEVGWRMEVGLIRNAKLPWANHQTEESSTFKERGAFDTRAKAKRSFEVKERPRKKRKRAEDRVNQSSSD